MIKLGKKFTKIAGLMWNQQILKISGSIKNMIRTLTSVVRKKTEQLYEAEVVAQRESTCYGNERG